MNRKIFVKVTELIISFMMLQIYFTGCAGVPGEKEKINLNGMVYDTQNRPVVNYRIYIDGKGECVSDIGGRFLLKGIRKGEHVFSGFGEGYLGIEEKIVVYDKSQILYIRIPSIDTNFERAFELIKKGDYDGSEKLVREVLECDGENEDALYFLETIEKLRRRNEKE